MLGLDTLFRKKSRGDVWSDWPNDAYSKPRYQTRLASVQSCLAECIDQVPSGEVNILSLCAGDGRDVIGAVANHPRRRDVAATLVEYNEQSVSRGRDAIDVEGLAPQVRFLHADGTVYETYADLPSADILVVCGVWGHVLAEERTQLLAALEEFGKPGARVIWTRGISRGRHRSTEIAEVFDGGNWRSTRTDITPDEQWLVATYEYVGPAKERPASGPIFAFQT